MTEEELQRIRTDFNTLQRKPQEHWDITDVSNMAALAVLKMPLLLAEVERLLAENQRLDIELFDLDMRLRALERENAELRGTQSSV